jgi:spermidine synthase
MAGMRSTHTAPAWLIPTLAVLFFVSGVSALIYQVLWLRLLSLVFGVSVYATSTVLAGFMAGLALGSYAGGRLGDRVRHPLAWFALAEVLIGATAWATPQLLRLAEQGYVVLYPLLPPSVLPLTTIRFLLSFAILLIPTTLMGATLPLIIKSSVLRDEGFGHRAGLLYATNTTGAVTGVLLAGFYLIGSAGIERSFRLAATLNVLVGTAAALAAMARARHMSAAQTPEAARPAGTAPVREMPESIRRLVLIVFVLSGFAALALEVIWFRVLVLFFPATTYAFTTVLAVVLCGIAAGSFLITPFMRSRRDWLATLALLELGIALFSLASFAFAHTHLSLAWADPLYDHPVVDERAPMLLTSLLVVLPPTLLMGAAFPIGLRLWAGDDDNASRETARRVGLFYSLNVVGGIAGAVVAGFLLLPLLGSRRSAVLVAAISLAGALLLLRALAADRVRLAAGSAIAGICLFAGLALFMEDPYALVMSHRYPGQTTLWREEGVQTTVSVHQPPEGGRLLYLDGLHQANDSEGMIRVHAQIGHLAMALHPAPKSALVIGLGGGVTAGAVSQHRSARIQLVELSEAVVHGSEWFRHANNDVLRQPNVDLRIDDGRNYLLLARPQHDVITADIIQPIHAGAGNLYAVEYFQLARNALTDSGLVLQWIGRRPDTHYKLIMRTFLTAFPETTLWADGTLLVGTKQPLKLDRAAFEHKLRDPEVKAALSSVGLGSFDALLAHYTAGPEELRQFVGPGPILTDDRPQLEYFLSLPREDPTVDISGLRGAPTRLLSAAEAR